MNIQENQNIGELVALDYRAASIFKQHNIDFCCQGNRSIQEACTKQNIDYEIVVNDLEKVLQAKSSESLDYTSWPLDLLVDYIEKKHHRFVTEKTAEIIPYLDKICEVHGNEHPELFEIKTQFNASAEELKSHMKKEEMILFPFVRQMINAPKDSLATSPFGSIQNPINMMMHEHSTEGERFRKIVELSNNYTAPKDACNTYKITFALLKEFEEDLHLHIHLENNILFPKAVELEKH